MTSIFDPAKKIITQELSLYEFSLIFSLTPNISEEGKEILSSMKHFQNQAMNRMGICAVNLIIRKEQVDEGREGNDGTKARRTSAQCEL